MGAIGKEGIASLRLSKSRKKIIFVVFFEEENDEFVEKPA